MRLVVNTVLVIGHRKRMTHWVRVIELKVRKWRTSGDVWVRSSNLESGIRETQVTLERGA